ncbi:MAG: 16S rRNA (cytosine(967)-C(5))-methyltransferase RsmB [Clostridiales bacterium]|nr:16S rRNA (cytosine(967)-C(5))-methyltransferase RsmB [Clostridiales bacterium]
MAREGKAPLPAREAALLILNKIVKDGAYANLETARVLSACPYPGNEAALVTELVYGVCRMQAACDWLLNRLLSKPPEKLPLPILLILRMGIYQLLYLQKIPPSAAVDESVKLAKKYGHAGTAALVNAVLRAFCRRREELNFPAKEGNPALYLHTALSHPEWLAEYLLGMWPLDDAEAFCLYNNASHGISIRANTLKTSREQLKQALTEEGIEAQESAFAPEGLILRRVSSLEKLNAFKEGLFMAQEQSSMLAAHALSPAPGAKVLDICAAPGGKTTHLAQLMGNRGAIRALDKHPHKIALIEENCRRLGIDIVQAEAADARQAAGALAGWADYLLLDAPCSGLGVLARRADARWRKTSADIAAMSALGRELLCAAADMLASGGVMVFSTCTVTREENRENLEWFLQSRPDFVLEPLALPFVPNQAQKEAHECGFWQILPQNEGIEGFFIARLRKNNI